MNLTDPMKAMSTSNARMTPQRADRMVRDYYADSLSMTRFRLANVSDTIGRFQAVDDDDSITSNEAYTAAILDNGALTRAEFDGFADRGELADLVPVDTLILHRWSQSRAILTVDSGLLDSLLDTDWGDTPIPASVLAQIPYPDPAIVLPAPIIAPHDGAAIGGLVLRERFDMFTITGLRPFGPGETTRCSTNHPSRVGYTINFFGRLIGEDGSEHRLEMHAPDGGIRNMPLVVGMNLAVPVANLTMDGYVAAAISECNVRRQPGWDPSVVGDDVLGAITTRMVRTALGLLVYMGTDSPDMAETTEKLKKRTRPGRGRPDSDTQSTTVTDVGYRIGAALRSSHSEAQSMSDTEGDGTGRRVAPHMRRAHTAIRWVGKGRTEKRLVWIAPTWVNTDLDDHRTHIHRVR